MSSESIKIESDRFLSRFIYLFSKIRFSLSQVEFNGGYSLALQFILRMKSPFHVDKNETLKIINFKETQILQYLLAFQ